MTTDSTQQHISDKSWYGVVFVSVIAYGTLAVFYNTSWLSASRLNRELFVWPLWIVLAVSYLKGYQSLLRYKDRAQPYPSTSIVAGGIVLGLLAVMTPAFHSTDLFGYVNRGWQQVEYGLNPYIHTVKDIPGWKIDPMLTNHWVSNPSPYGFLYLQIAKLLTWIGQGSKPLTVLVFKLGNLLVYVLTAWLIQWGVQGGSHSKTHAPSQNTVEPLSILLYLFLWNPLILVHGLANGHNDVWMGLFILLGLCCALRQYSWAILPSLMAATLIKYAAIVALPLAFIYHIRQKQWRSLLLGSVLAIVIFWGAGSSYLSDWSDFNVQAIQKNAFVTHGSFHAMLYHSYENLAQLFYPAGLAYTLAVRSALKTALLGGYALFCLTLGLKRLLQSNAYNVNQLITDSLMVIAVLIGLVSLKFYPWYLGMFFPVVFLLPGSASKSFWFFIVLSCSQLLSLTFIGQAHILNFLVMTGLPLLWLVLKKQEDKQST